MRTQFTILLALVCLNLAFGLTIALQLPGTEYVQPSDPGSDQINATQYEEHFNATDIADKWQWTNYGIPILGDIFAAFEFFATNWQFLIDGFPTFILWVSDSLIVDATAKTTFLIIANVLRAIFGLLMCVLFIEFIGGRYFTD